MSEVTFITGNKNKADYAAKYLGFPLHYKKLDLNEIQSLDLREIVEYKVKQAYDIIKTPVLVEDVSLEFDALGGLPGPFIKFFNEQIAPEDICAIVNGKTRKATARCVFGYYDGQDLELFEGSLGGEIADKPSGDGGYGFDCYFIPEGYSVTRSALNEEEDKITYLKIKPFEKIKKFLEKKTTN